MNWTNIETAEPTKNGLYWAAVKSQETGDIYVRPAIWNHTPAWEGAKRPEIKEWKIFPSDDWFMVVAWSPMEVPKYA